MALSCDDVGFEPGAIVIVDYLHAFALDQACSIHQFFVNCDTPHIVEISLGDDCSVDL